MRPHMPFQRQDQIVKSREAQSIKVTRKPHTYIGLYNLRIPILGFAFFMLEDETFREPDTALDFEPDGHVTAAEGPRSDEG